MFQLFVHSMKVSGDQCCFRPHLLSLLEQKCFKCIDFLCFKEARMSNRCGTTWV